MGCLYKMTKRVFLEMLVGTVKIRTPKVGLPQTCYISTYYYGTYYISKNTTNDEVFREQYIAKTSYPSSVLT